MFTERNKPGLAVAAVAALTLFTGCGLLGPDAREAVSSADVPAGEVRQQYEITYLESEKTVLAVAYFLRDSRARNVEQQLMLEGGASVRVNGREMKLAVCDQDNKLCDKSFYEAKLKLPIDAIDFEYVDADGKKYRNRVALPAVKLKTDLKKGIVRGQPLDLLLDVPENATPDFSLASRTLRSAVIAPERTVEWGTAVHRTDAEARAALAEKHIAAGLMLPEAHGYRFEGDQTSNLKLGENYLIAGYQIRLPLVQPTSAAGGFIRVRHEFSPVAVEVVER